MSEISRKYQIHTKENKEFLDTIRENLFSFGHKFPSPGGSSYYLGDDGAPWTDRSRETPDKLARLYESISYADGEVSFTIPDGDDTWNIHISGKTYSFDVSSAKYSRFIELYLDAELNGEEISVDVLDFLPKYLKMRNDLEDNTVKTE